jgi:hypothetical protein
LPALAAKNQGQEDFLPITWHELLPIQRQVSLVLRLQGGIDRVAAADKLVEPKREGWKSGCRIAFAGVDA